jgi:hypothetical protein
MAIVGTTYGGYESKWGFSEESTFGTAIADNGTFEMLDSPIPSVDSGIFRINTVKNGDGRMRNASNRFTAAAGGLRIISFSDVFLRQKDLGVLLYAVGQNVAEGAGTPFEKTYTLSTSTTQPDFSANAGFFCTVGIYDTIASYHRKYTSCILRTLTLSSDLAGDGVLRASGEFISGFAESTTANFSGTWAYNTNNVFNFHVTPTKTINTADVVLFGFDITINNNAVRTGDTGATGDCETYTLSTKSGYDVSGNLKVKYDTNVQGLIADDRAGTPRAIQLACGTDGVAGNFDLTASSCQLQNLEKDYGEPRGQAIDIPFMCNSSVVFTVSDALDRTW